MEARKEKGLCFNCDEKFTKGHRCPAKQLYLLIGEEEEADEEEDAKQLDDDPLTLEEMQISVHALAGSNSFRTMRIIGNLKGRNLTILIDSGSTHNFVEPSIVKWSGQKVESTEELPVTVADGTKLGSKGLCKGLTWKMQGEEFTADVRVLAIGGV